MRDTTIEDGRIVVAAWRDAAAPQVPVYVTARGAPTWAYYSTDWARPDMARLDWYAAKSGSGGRAFRNAGSRRHVEPDDEQLLIWRAGPRVDLLGAPSGIRFIGGGLSQTAPDPGWAQNEALKIRRIASPDVWLFFAHTMGMEQTDLLKAVEAIGGRRTSTHTGRGAAIYRVSF